MSPRLTAAANKDSKYFGSACKRCGNTLRYTCNSGCVSCLAARHTAFKAKTSKEDRSIFWKTLRSRHLDKAKEHVRRWKRKNPGRVSAINRARDAQQLRACPVWVNTADLQQIYVDASYVSKLMNIKYHVDHIVPLVHDLVCGLHVPWNLQILSAEENIAKGNKFNG